jgi:hypothetical protein
VTSGARLLAAVESFVGRFVAYPSAEARVAHVLWVAHTHAMSTWESTPRIAFLSPEPGSGKTRALEVTEPLVPRPVHAVNTTPAYLFRKVSDPAGTPTILYDEIDTLFGPRAKENEDVRGMLNAGHRKGAVAGRCVVKGREVSTEELPAYCAVALAGLDDLPDTLMSRSVVVRMRRRAPQESIEPWRHRLHAPEGEAIRDRLASWTRSLRVGTWPAMPAGVEDRNADIWEALLAVADAAGGDWPKRARVAAVTLVTDAKAAVPSLGVRLLGDLKSVFGERDRMFTEDVLAALVGLDEAPWSDLRGKPLDARGLAFRLGKYGVHPRLVRDADQVFRGYTRADLADSWSRYVTAVEANPLSETERLIDNSQCDEPLLGTAAKGSVTSVTAVTTIPVESQSATFDDADGLPEVSERDEAGFWDGDSSDEYVDSFGAEQPADVEHLDGWIDDESYRAFWSTDDADDFLDSLEEAVDAY